MKINQMVKGETVTMTGGDFRGQQATFRKITGYTGGYGAVCQLKMEDGRLLEFTSDFFKFNNPDTQMAWDNDDIDFELE